MVQIQTASESSAWFARCCSPSYRILVEGKLTLLPPLPPPLTLYLSLCCGGAVLQLSLVLPMCCFRGFCSESKELGLLRRCSIRSSLNSCPSIFIPHHQPASLFFFLFHQYILRCNLSLQYLFRWIPRGLQFLACSFMMYNFLATTNSA